jgi:hypothetical protein
MSMLQGLMWTAMVLLTTAQAPGSVHRLRPPYRPFIDPLEVHGWWWWMLIPMSLGIAVVYKAVRVRTVNERWAPYLREVGIMTVQIVVGMVMLVAASYALVEVYARWMVSR